MVRRRAGGGYFTILTPPAGSRRTKRVAYRSQVRPPRRRLPGPEVPRRPAGVPRRRTATTRTSSTPTSRTSTSTRSSAPARHGRGPRRRHRGVPGPAAADRRPGRHGAADPDRARLPHLRHRRARAQHLCVRRGRRRLGLPGFQLPEVGLGRAAQGRMRQLEGDDRAALYKAMGGTNTPMRRSWQQQMARGRARAGTAPCRARSRGRAGRRRRDWSRRIKTGRRRAARSTPSYIIDCTGLEADIAEHRLLADLLEHGGAGRNPLGRLDVERTLRGTGTASGDGRTVRLRARPPSAATSPASTRSSACRSPRRRSPTTWPGAGFVPADRPGPIDGAVVQLGPRNAGLRERDMVPTLLGSHPDPDLRCSSSSAVCWTLRSSPRCCPGGGTTSRQRTARCTPCSLIVVVLGVGWELVYHLLMQFRWEKDWPTLFGLLVGVPEGSAGATRWPRRASCPYGRARHLPPPSSSGSAPPGW